MTNNIEKLSERYSSMSDEDLKRIVTVDYADYQEDALDIAKSEFQKRGITDISISSTQSHDFNKTEKSKIKKILARTIFYILWLSCWLLMNMIYVENKSELSDIEIYLLKEMFKIEDLKTMALIVGYTISSLQFIIFGLLFYGLYLITKKTKQFITEVIH